jgi:hypothetical protein
MIDSHAILIHWNAISFCFLAHVVINIKETLTSAEHCKSLYADGKEL